MARKKKRPVNLDELFGQLRSLMNAPSWTQEDRQELMRLVRIAYKNDPQRHKHQWIPYIEGFPHHFETVFGQHNNTDQWHQDSILLPTAKWRLNCFHESFLEIHRAMIDAPHPESVVEFYVNSNSPSLKETSAIYYFFARTNLNNIRRLMLDIYHWGYQDIRPVASASLEQLVELYFYDYHPDEDSLDILLQADFIPNLTHLSLHGYRFNQHIIHQLRNDARLSHLQELVIKQYDNG